ncbi:hypothetical protein [Neobacillus muris]|uniref:hypothetical protein n=1 Tax=Neobacillus muris TaxID=2941334 RepID=UPI00203E32D2|nr:hypothetical protein [Neobacillus muris]
MNNWVNNLLNIGRKQNLFNMFNRKRNNRGVLWASLLGLGVSVAALRLRRNGNKNMLAPIQNIVKYGQIPKMTTALMEFSKELVPNKNKLTNK